MLYLILLIGSGLRFLLLNSFPTGITDDELHFVLNAKSIFFTGKNLAQNWSPFQLTTIPNEQSSELTHLIYSFLLGPFPTNLFTARLPLALVGTLSIYLIFRFVKNTSQNTNLALVSAFVYAINPWAIYTSRTAFDAPLSLFFILVGLTLATEKSNIKFLTPLAFFLSFYTYIANKTLLLPLLLATYFFYYRHTSKNIFKVTIFVVATITCLFAIKQLGQKNRTSELVSPNLQKFKRYCNKRKKSVYKNYLYKVCKQHLYHNHKICCSKISFHDPKILFTTGDNTFLVSMWKHGYFYYIDFLFILIGLTQLHKYNKKFVALIIVLTVIAPLPSILRNDDLAAIAFHSSLTFPSLSILSGIGLLSLINTRKAKIILTAAILVSVLNFSYIYIFQYPVYQPEGFSFTNRQVSEFLIQNNTKKIQVITRQPETIAKNYIFYSNLYNPKIKSEIANIYTDRNNIIFQNLTIKDVPPKQYLPNQLYLVQSEKFDSNIATSRGDIKNITTNQPTYQIVGEHNTIKYTQ